MWNFRPVSRSSPWLGGESKFVCQFEHFRLQFWIGQKLGVEGNGNSSCR